MQLKTGSKCLSSGRNYWSMNPEHKNNGQLKTWKPNLERDHIFTDVWIETYFMPLQSFKMVLRARVAFRQPLPFCILKTSNHTWLTPIVGFLWNPHNRFMHGIFHIEPHNNPCGNEAAKHNELTIVAQRRTRWRGLKGGYTYTGIWYTAPHQQRGALWYSGGWPPHASAYCAYGAHGLPPSSTTVISCWPAICCCCGDRGGKRPRRTTAPNSNWSPLVVSLGV